MNFKFFLISLILIFLQSGTFAQITVSASSGTISGTYSTLNATFTAINSGIHQGDIDISINGNVTEPSNPISLLASGQGSSLYTSIGIKPTVPCTISGTGTAGFAVIMIDGADNVEIDGSIVVGGNSKDLTIQNVSPNIVANIAAIRLIGRTSGGLGVNNFTLKNCNVIGSTPGNNGYSGSNVTTGYCVYAGGLTTNAMQATAAGNNYDNFTIQNNNFTNAYIGFYIAGGAATQADNFLFENNEIGSLSNPIGNKGLVVSQIVNGTIRNNQIFNIQSLASVDIMSLDINGFSTNNLLVEKNDFFNIKSNSILGYGAYGINVTAGNNINLVNNLIHGISSVNSPNNSIRSAFGIRLAGGLNVGVFYNSVNLYDHYGNFSSNNAFSAAFGVTGTGVTATVKNNIFSNKMTSNAGVQEFVAITFPSSYNFANVSLDNNAYMVSNDNNHLTGKIGFFAGFTGYNLLSDWQTVSQVSNPGNDVNSIPALNKVAAPFISNTDLNINSSTTTQLESGGIAIASIASPNVDYNSLTRPAFGNLAPDIGAFEFDGLEPGDLILPVVNTVSLIDTQSCSLIAHEVNADVSDNLGVFNVILAYSYDGVAQTPINMTLQSGTSLSGIWSGIIPPTSGSQVLVEYSVIALDNDFNVSLPVSGINYSDDFLGMPYVNLIVSDTSICTGNSSTLNLALSYDSIPAPNYINPPAIANPTVEEDLGSITISQGASTIFSNVSSVNSLVGSIGTAQGVAGSYSNFTNVAAVQLILGESYDYAVSSLINGSGSFNHSMAIFIDFNKDGDFSDSGERIHTAASTQSGAHTESGSFMVPNGAKLGTTRMRISVHEGVIFNEGQTINFGEYEEYRVVISPEIDSIIWSDGMATVGTGSFIIVSPTVNTTYTASIYSENCLLSQMPGAQVSVAPVLLSLSPLNVTCFAGNNGSFAVSGISCGTGPFQFSVNGGVFGGIPNNLSAGTYSVVVRDNSLNLSNPQNLIISQPNALSAPSLIAGASVCSGANTAVISASANGNTVNYYDAATGGNFLGSGTSFETVGTLVLPNTNTPGIYSFYAQSDSASCSSLGRTKIDVIVKALATSTDVLVACDSLTWINGITYYTSNNVATFTYPNGAANGCDSIVTLNLTLNQSTYSNVIVVECDTYTWPQNGATYSLSGIYNDTIQNSNLCDSVISLNLTINNSYADTITVDVCDQYIWAANAQTYITTGFYIANFSTVNGCDSIKNLNLIIRNKNYDTLQITNCDSYTWSQTGINYTLSGLYNDTILNTQMCDSIITLDLTINNSNSSNTNVISCDSYLWPQTGQNYLSSGIYKDTVTNIVGCDSIVQLTLTINNSYSDTLNVVSCDTFTWNVNNTSYTTSGTYSLMLSTINGCDSLKVLELIILNSTYDTLDVVACDSFAWNVNGNNYYSSGTFTDTIPNSVGCDSIVTLNLTINNATFSSFNTSACDSFLWSQNGMIYYSSGSYNDTISNAAMCDSIITLNLTINDSYEIIENISACDSFVWNVNNNTYFNSGNYSVPFTTVQGCDSVHILNLTINNSSISSQNIDACDLYIWPLNGQSYSSTGNYTDTIPTLNGCDSIVTLNLNVYQSFADTQTVEVCDSYYWSQSDLTYNASGQYIQTYTTVNSCDSVYVLELTINSIVATATDNGDLSISASSGATYQWINCSDNSIIGSETGSVINVTQNGTYAVIITSSDGCIDTSNCVIIDNVGMDENDFANFKMYPNPTSGDLYLEFESENAIIKVYDAEGRVIITENVKSGHKIDLNQFEPAVYFLEVILNESIKSFKIVKVD